MITTTAAQIRTALLACTTEAEARTYLAGLRVTAPALRAIAEQLEVPAGRTKAATIAALIKVFVGGRLLTLAVRF